MKIAGLLLIVSGWMLMLAALVLLAGLAARTAFAGAGLAVEGLGVGLLARAHTRRRKKRNG